MLAIGAGGGDGRGARHWDWRKKEPGVPRIKNNSMKDGSDRDTAAHSRHGLIPDTKAHQRQVAFTAASSSALKCCSPELHHFEKGLGVQKSMKISRI
jgi:hypothetical protein